eukprot:2274674-Pleurochrysis_carterae.AAC.1
MSANEWPPVLRISIFAAQRRARTSVENAPRSSRSTSSPCSPSSSLPSATSAPASAGASALKQISRRAALGGDGTAPRFDEAKRFELSSNRHKRARARVCSMRVCTRACFAITCATYALSESERSTCETLNVQHTHIHTRAQACIVTQKNARSSAQDVELHDEQVVQPHQSSMRQRAEVRWVGGPLPARACERTKCKRAAHAEAIAVATGAAAGATAATSAPRGRGERDQAKLFVFWRRSRGGERKIANEGKSAGGGRKSAGGGRKSAR